jgi:hypothetical protein
MMRLISAKGFAWCVLAGISLYQVTLYALNMALGHLRLLSQDTYRALFLTLSLTLFVIALVNTKSLVRDLMRVRYSPHWIDLLIAPSLIMTALTIYFQMVRDWSVGAHHFDSLNYHIPKALHWFWQGNFDGWRTAVWQQVGQPAGGDTMLLSIIFLGCGWLGGAWTGAWDTVGAAFAIYVISRSFSIPARQSLLGALAFLSFPSIGLRVNQINTDMAAAFPVIAAVAFFRTIEPIGVRVFTYAALTGLGLAAKGYVLFAAIPITLYLFLPLLRELLTSPSAIVGGLLGTIVAGIFFLCSFMPTYRSFNTFSGGATGLSLSSFGQPWSTIARTTVANMVTWSLEPLGFLPPAFRESLFKHIHLESLYSAVGLTPRWFPQLHTDENRTGIISVLLAPWLFLSLPRGFRWAVGALFFAVFLSLTSTLSLNLATPRFAVITVALFAILWAARAKYNPIIVSLLILSSSWFAVHFVFREGYASRWTPHYSDQIEGGYKKLREEMGDDQVLLIFAQGLNIDALATGRLGRWRYQYIDCPPEGSYHDWLINLKTTSRWMKFNSDAIRARYGPLFQSNLGKMCPEIEMSKLKEELTAAGWRYHSNVGYVEEVWRAD